MNILLIAVLIMLIGCIAIGYWKGFIRIACSLAAMIVTIVLVGWATPYISDFLKENTTVYEDLVEKCSETIRLSAKKETDNEKEESEKGSEETDNKEESADSGKIGGIQLPKLWVEQILQETGDSLDQVMEENDIYRKAGEYIAEWIIRGIAFFAAFILVSIVLKLVIGLLDLVAKLPIIKGFNHLLGGIAGLIQGLLIVWLLMFLVAIACTSQLGQTLTAYIHESKILTFLYQHNGIMYFFNLVFG